MVYIDPSLPSIRADIRAKPIIVFQIDVDVINLKWSLFMLILELKMVENFRTQQSQPFTYELCL